MKISNIPSNSNPSIKQKSNSLNCKSPGILPVSIIAVLPLPMSSYFFLLLCLMESICNVVKALITSFRVASVIYSYPCAIQFAHLFEISSEEESTERNAFNLELFTKSINPISLLQSILEEENITSPPLLLLALNIEK